MNSNLILKKRCQRCQGTGTWHPGSKKVITRTDPLIKNRTIKSLFAILFLIVVYSVSMTFIKNEDFIGSYYRVNIRPDIALEICGTAKGILDLKEDEEIICDIDSMIVGDDVIYGICRKGYFLMTLSNREVTYSAGPMSQYSAYSLLSPMEYYKKETMYIDVLGLIVLFLCLIFVIKGWYHKRNLQR